MGIIKRIRGIQKETLFQWTCWFMCLISYVVFGLCLAYMFHEELFERWFQ